MDELSIVQARLNRLEKLLRRPDVRGLSEAIAAASGDDETLLDAVRRHLLAAKQSGRSLTSIAEMGGIDRVALSRFSRGEVGLSGETLSRLCAALDLTVCVKSTQNLNLSGNICRMEKSNESRNEIASWLRLE